MDSTVFNNILREYESARDNASAQLELRKSEVYSAIPRLREIDDAISKLSIQVTKAILGNSNDTKKLVEELQQKSMDLKIEKGELLATHNYPTDYLTIKHQCKACHDTGFVNNQRCSCLKQKLIDYAYKQSNLADKLSCENFDTFDFEYYSDTKEEGKKESAKENIKKIYKACLNYAANFDSIDENLLFTGPTGLGKTFLSSCIAKDLLDKGKTVFYQTAFKIFEILEEYQFAKDKSSVNKSTLELLFDVDLLIIDDLGSEFINSYTSSEFFNILNSRLHHKKKTIISTNLSLNELSNLYSERVISRILGNYNVLEFFGEDIRIKKKLA